MNREQIKTRYTRIAKRGSKTFIVELMVVPQYFETASTNEGREHAEWFQDRLVDALEKMQMEMVHDALNELGVE